MFTFTRVRRLLVAVCVLLLAGAALVCWNQLWRDDDSSANSHDPLPFESRGLVAYFQARYPFKPLADRLAYEQSRRQLPFEVLTEEAGAYLASEERNMRWLRSAYGSREVHRGQWQSIQRLHGFNDSTEPVNRAELPPPSRLRSLYELHMRKRDDFVAFDSAFGIGRMPVYWSLAFLDLPEAAPIAVATLEDLEAPAARQPVKLPEANEPYLNPYLLPTLSHLRDFHSQGARQFVNAAGWGLSWEGFETVRQEYDRGAHFRDPDLRWISHIKSDRSPGMRFSGFQAHHFRERPDLIVRPGQLSADGAFRPAALPSLPPADGPDSPLSRWLIARLELVSLLKHESPRVYVSKHLPRMQDLAKPEVPTRALDPFERVALQRLIRGEQLVVAAEGNRIFMLGAIRALEQCRSCHDAQEGALLGAFTYELRRQHPVVVEGQD